MGLIGDITKMALVVEYDGTEYYGFQLQDNVPTIQGELEKGIQKLTGEMSRVAASSRTDTGVHARGQVVSFITRATLPPRKYVEGLNHYLPEDISVRVAQKVSATFDVRGDAVSREYKYYIWNSRERSPMWRRYSYQVKGHLNIENMNRACEALRGRHDFSSFVTDLDEEEAKESAVRDVYGAGVVREGGIVVFSIEASSFLRHQVRNTVGAIIRVGLGGLSIDEFNNIIEAKKMGLAGPAAPSLGLCLERVKYPDDLWEKINENL